MSAAATAALSKDPVWRQLLVGLAEQRRQQHSERKPWQKHVQQISMDSWRYRLSMQQDCSAGHHVRHVHTACFAAVLCCVVLCLCTCSHEAEPGEAAVGPCAQRLGALAQQGAG